MASLQSSLNHGLPGCFGFVEVFGIVSSAIDITVSLNFKIGSVGDKVFKFFAFVGVCFTTPQGVMSMEVAHDDERDR